MSSKNRDKVLTKISSIGDFHHHHYRLLMLLPTVEPTPNHSSVEDLQIWAIVTSATAQKVVTKASKQSLHSHCNMVCRARLLLSTSASNARFVISSDALWLTVIVTRPEPAITSMTRFEQAQCVSLAVQHTQHLLKPAYTTIWHTVHHPQTSAHKKESKLVYVNRFSSTFFWFEPARSNLVLSIVTLKII